jgi:hypothetical protein
MEFKDLVQERIKYFDTSILIACQNYFGEINFII